MDERRITATLVLASALGLAMVLLAVAILVAVVTGSRDLSETATRALTVAFTACAGVLGFELGKGRQP